MISSLGTKTSRCTIKTCWIFFTIHIKLKRNSQKKKIEEKIY